MSIEAMKQALEALNEITGWQSLAPGYVWDEVEDAITALRTAIEQAEKQDPPVFAELLCVCGAEWQWRNRDWELLRTPAAPVRERNFCERCGKRLGGEGHIHTCTPPAKE